MAKTFREWVCCKFRQLEVLIANSAGGGGGTSDGGIIPLNTQPNNYTTVLSDVGKAIFHPFSDFLPRTYTIADNATVPYDVGTCLTFVNELSAGEITIDIAGTDFLYLSGIGSTGSRTLVPTGIATAIKIRSNAWIISGTGLT